MTTPLFHLSLPDTGDDAHFAPLQIALEGLTRINEWHIERGLKRGMRAAAQGWTSDAVIIPPLYLSGVRYREEPPGHEDWIDAPGVLQQGHADCEDLAAWRAAELRVAGRMDPTGRLAALGYCDVEPVIKWQWIPRELLERQGYPKDKLPRDGVWLVHCVVRWPDGRIEDPSKILGMGGEYTERI